MVRFEEAVEIWERCVTEKLPVDDAHRRMVKCLEDRALHSETSGILDNAVATYHIALGIRPREPRLLVNLGICYSRMGWFNDAIGAFNDALKIDPGSFAGWLNRGIALLECSLFKKAEHSFDKASEIDPESPDPYYYKGVSLVNKDTKLKIMHSRNRKLASDCFRQALPLDPNHHQARTALQQLS